MRITATLLLIAATAGCKRLPSESRAIDYRAYTLSMHLSPGPDGAPIGFEARLKGPWSELGCPRPLAASLRAELDGHPLMVNQREGVPTGAGGQRICNGPVFSSTDSAALAATAPIATLRLSDDSGAIVVRVEGLGARREARIAEPSASGVVRIGEPIAVQWSPPGDALIIGPELRAGLESGLDPAGPRPECSVVLISGRPIVEESGGITVDEGALIRVFVPAEGKVCGGRARLFLTALARPRIDSCTGVERCEIDPIQRKVGPLPLEISVERPPLKRHSQ